MYTIIRCPAKPNQNLKSLLLPLFRCPQLFLLPPPLSPSLSLPLLPSLKRQDDPPSQRQSLLLLLNQRVPNLFPLNPLSPLPRIMQRLLWMKWSREMWISVLLNSLSNSWQSCSNSAFSFLLSRASIVDLKKSGLVS